ncbi:MAG: metal-dependent hydrolase [Novosphingobium sp.]|nr:metal-dependent hydrolase [Novosphingobium sp.]
MDNLTHSLVGALIGQAGLKRKTGLAMPALIIGANLPDIDAACVVYGIESLTMRRGITHGPIAWVLLPLVLAGLLWWFDNWQARRGKRPEGRGEVRFGWLFGLAFVACLTHPALDWLNNYGIRLLEPFSSEWFYGDTLFIIDIWLWLGLGFATWISLRRERRAGGEWRKPARFALTAALIYIGLNWGISQLARENALLREPYPSIVITNPAPIAFWHRELLLRDHKGQWQSSEWYGPVAGQGYRLPSSAVQCASPETDALIRGRPDLAAFLFWSRAPYAERAATGEGIVLHDARFASLGGGRFSVALPGVACLQPPRTGR